MLHLESINPSINLDKQNVLLSLLEEAHSDLELAPILEQILIQYKEELTREQKQLAFYSYCQSKYNLCAEILLDTILPWCRKSPGKRGIIVATKYLIDKGVPYQENIYNKVLTTDEPCMIAEVVSVFVENEVDIESEKALYDRVLSSRCRINMAGLSVLIYRYFPLNENRELYEILSYQDNEKLVGFKKAFRKLNASNLSVENYIALCKLFFEEFLRPGECDICDKESLANSIIYLLKMQFPFEIIKVMFSVLNLSDRHQKWVEEILILFFDFGMKFSDFRESFYTRILSEHYKIIFEALNKLVALGYRYEIHKDVFQFIFNMLHDREASSYQIIMEMLKNMENYAAKNTLLDSQDDGYQNQITKLNEMLEISVTTCDQLLEGPLKKSKGTQKIEILLQQMVEQYIDEYEYISFNKAKEYILTLPGKKAVNLSLLFRNANLSQIVLSEALIGQIEVILTQLVPEMYSSYKYENNELVKLLPEIQQIAIDIYISPTGAYDQINQLFRSEPMNNSGFSLHEEPAKNRLCFFLLGCLLNDAINKLNWLKENMSEKTQFDRLMNQYYTQSHHYDFNCATEEDLSNLLAWVHERGIIEEREYNILLEKVPSAFLSFYQQGTLIRDETLNDEMIRRRVANPWKLPALTSFSCGRDTPLGSDKKNVRTVLQGAPHLCEINENEWEVLLVQGEQVVTYQTPEYLISMIKRSPSLEPKYHYWSEKALAYAYEHYFSKEYLKEESLIGCGGEEVMRPNHNMTHAYRVMLMIEMLVDYFADHASELNFKMFCENLGEQELEWLRVGAVFIATGRESEIADDLAEYEYYREASGEHFLKFIAQTKENKQEMAERIYHVIRYIDNPEYESDINIYLDENERNIRNFYHRLFTTAYRLDLPRRCCADELQNSMEYVKKLCEQSGAQQKAFEAIIRYNIELIKEHGASLSCDIDTDGHLFDCEINYQPIYGESSNLLKRLFERTELVSKPHKKRYTG